jgi:signal transduction histidine kinase
MGVSAKPVTSGELAQVAAVARRALSADAVLIASRSAGQPPAWVGAAGVTAGELETLGRALARMAGEFGRSSIVQIASVREWEVPYAGALARHGFLSVLCAAVELDGAHAGEIYALRRTEGPWNEAELISVFARHAVVTVAHRRLRRASETLAERLEDRDALDALVLSATDFKDLTRKLYEHVAPLFGAGLIGIMVWDDDRHVLQMVPGSFNADDELVSSYQVGGRDAHSNAARVFATGRPYLSNDARGDPGILQDYVAAFGIESTLSLPLGAGERTIGVLHIANKASGYTVEDLQRGELLAPRIASVVEIARTMFRIRRLHGMESILSRLAVTIASGTSVQDFLGPALRDLCAATEANVIALVTDGSIPVIGRHRGVHATREAQLLDAAARATQVEASVLRPQQPGDPGWATLLVPVRFGDQRIGAIAAGRLRGEPFTADERSALERLGSLAALAYTSERYQRQRAELARLEERDRIADDLHDDVAQILFGAQMALDTALEQSDVTPEVTDLILRARRLVLKGDASLREAIYALARPTTADLRDRLGEVVTAVEQAYGLPVHLEIADLAATAARGLTAPMSDSLIKVAREALVNAAKHAGPCRVTVLLDLDTDARLSLAIVDDGLGPGDRGAGHGLTSMRRAIERQGGSLMIRAGSAGGSTVTATIPV